VLQLHRFLAAPLFAVAFSASSLATPAIGEPARFSGTGPLAIRVLPDASVELTVAFAVGYDARRQRVSRSGRA